MAIYEQLARAWARCEEALIVCVLPSLVLVAWFPAAVRNLTHFDIAWANAVVRARSATRHLPPMASFATQPADRRWVCAPSSV